MSSPAAGRVAMSRCGADAGRIILLSPGVCPCLVISKLPPEAMVGARFSQGRKEVVRNPPKGGRPGSSARGSSGVQADRPRVGSPSVCDPRSGGPPLHVEAKSSARSSWLLAPRLLRRRKSPPSSAAASRQSRPGRCLPGREKSRRPDGPERGAGPFSSGGARRGEPGSSPRRRGSPAIMAEKIWGRPRGDPRETTASRAGRSRVKAGAGKRARRGPF